MDRGTIAKFLTAKRTISPLTSLSLLIVAGFFAGSLHVLSAVPQDNQSLVALGNGTTPDASKPQTAYNGPTPDSCTDAIDSAYASRSKIGPKVTSVIGDGESGTLDSCFGAVLKYGGDVNKKVDYTCVGRSGYVMFNDAYNQAKATSITSPDASVNKGKCWISVCRGSVASPLTCFPAKMFEGGTADKNLLGAGSVITNAGYSTMPEGIGNDAIPRPNDPLGPNNFDTYSEQQPVKPKDPGANNFELWSEQQAADAAAKKAQALGPNNFDTYADQQAQKARDLGPNNFDQYSELAAKARQNTNTNTGCAPGATCTAGNPPYQQSTFGDPRSGQSQQGGGFMSGLQSFLGGLMRGFMTPTSGMPGSQPQTCPTDPRAYAQYQQQYNYQLQQYNYQLQQYNSGYQNSYNSYGYGPSYSSYPQPPQPCTPSQNSTGGGQCQSTGSQPDPASCKNGVWRQMTTNSSGSGMCPQWQCVSGITPTAKITCTPDVAEPGSTVTISYDCGNSTMSTGYGFSTGGKSLGIATSTIQNIPGATAANFAIKCEKNGITTGAQCSVQIAKFAITMKSIPEYATEGKSVLVGWVTTGMRSCTISSPDQSDFTERYAASTKTSGVASSSPIYGPTDFYLNCTTVGGEEREEVLTVDLAGYVEASVENSSVAHGDNAEIRWDFPNAPQSAAVALWLYSIADKSTVALIQGHRAPQGTYTWNIPDVTDECKPGSSFVCSTDLIAGRSYSIVATLYTPINASLGEYNETGLPTPQFLDSPKTESFKVVR